MYPSQHNRLPRQRAGSSTSVQGVLYKARPGPERASSMHQPYVNENGPFDEPEEDEPIEPLEPVVNGAGPTIDNSGHLGEVAHIPFAGDRYSDSVVRERYGTHPSCSEPQ